MILLDTHIWLRWIIDAHDPLPTQIIERIESAERVAVSAISCWEVVMLEQRNRIQLPLPAADWIERALQPAGIERLAVTCAIATRAAGFFAAAARSINSFSRVCGPAMVAQLIGLSGHGSGGASCGPRVGN